MAMTKTKLGIIGVIAVVGVATLLALRHQSQSSLRETNQALREQAQQLAQQQADATQATKDDPEGAQREVTPLLRLENGAALPGRERQAIKQRPEPNQGSMPLAGPLYQGKPLSQWLATVNDREPDAAGNPQAGDPTEAGMRSNEAVQNLGTNAIPYLLSVMRGDNQQLRDKAVVSFRILGEAGAPAVPALRQLLQDNSPDVRREAAGALGGVGPLATAATPDLLAALGDEDSAVKCNAIYALD